MADNPVVGSDGKIKFVGLDALVAKLHDLGDPAVIEKIGFKGTYGSAQDLKRELIANIQASGLKLSTPSALLQGPAVKQMRFPGGGIGYTVGFRTGGSKKRKEAKGDPFYWWYLEFGTRYIAAKGFFRKAIQTWKSTAQGTLARQARAAMFKQAAAIAAKHGFL